MWKLTSLALTLSLMACATGSSQQNAHFARDLGLATAAETVEKARLVLGLHQFEIRQEEPAPNIYIETRWRERTPFEDEQAMGLTRAQVRAIVRARPRSGTSQMGEVYTVDMVVEQRVSSALNSNWTFGTMTPSARQYATRLADDLRQRLDVGVRRFGH